MYTIGCVNEIILYFLKLADALTNLCTMNVLNSEWKNQNFGEFFHSPFKTTLYNYYENWKTTMCRPVKSKSTLLPNFLFVLLYINCKSIMGWDVRSRRQYYTNIDELKKWTKILHSFVNSRENPISENILRVLAFVTCIFRFLIFSREIKVVQIWWNERRTFWHF